VTAQLREPDVTDGASRVSIHPQIRAWMVRLQQELGAKGGVVMEGRDIGTVVFPHADVKIFSTRLRRCAACDVTISSIQKPQPRCSRKRWCANCAPVMNATATAPIRRSKRR